MTSKNKANIIRLFRDYIIFFSTVMFVTLCSVLFFSKGLQVDFDLNRANTLYTILNIMFVSLLFLVFDNIRRSLDRRRNLDKITRGLNSITNGDFEYVIEKSKFTYLDGDYNKIIEQINKMTRELKSVEMLRNDFISNASHEFKTPLAIIQNYVTLIEQKDVSDEEFKEYLSKLHETTENLTSLVTNILSLNKLENQEIPPSLRRVNLSEHICDCLFIFEDELNKKNINVVSNIDDYAYVETDDELLSIVWCNLISNAIKFNNIHGTLTIEIKDSSESVTVSIADSGIGIDRNTGARIFDKFYQGKTELSSKGNGLGLSMVKRIITILGANIDVDSELGKGTMFTVTIFKQLN